MQEKLSLKGQQTRERIVALARSRLIDGGIDALVMRELAKSLEITLGNLQYYFATRDALILHVMEAEALLDVGTIEARVVKAPSAEAALRLAVSDLVNCWRGRSGVLFALLTALAGHNPVFRGPYRQIYRQFYAALEGVLKRLSPHLSAAEIRLRARLITALIDGSSMQIQVGDRAAYLQRVQDEAVRIAIHAA